MGHGIGCAVERIRVVQSPISPHCYHLPVVAIDMADDIDHRLTIPSKKFARLVEDIGSSEVVLVKLEQGVIEQLIVQDQDGIGGRESPNDERHGVGDMTVEPFLLLRSTARSQVRGLITQTQYRVSSTLILKVNPLIAPCESIR